MFLGMHAQHCRGLGPRQRHVLHHLYPSHFLPARHHAFYPMVGTPDPGMSITAIFFIFLEKEKKSSDVALLDF